MLDSRPTTPISPDVPGAPPTYEAATSSTPPPRIQVTETITPASLAPTSLPSLGPPALPSPSSSSLASPTPAGTTSGVGNMSYTPDSNSSSVTLMRWKYYTRVVSIVGLDNGGEGVEPTRCAFGTAMRDRDDNGERGVVVDTAGQPSTWVNALLEGMHIIINETPIEHNLVFKVQTASLQAALVSLDEALKRKEEEDIAVSPHVRRVWKAMQLRKAAKRSCEVEYAQEMEGAKDGFREARLLAEQALAAAVGGGEGEGATGQAGEEAEEAS